MVRLGEEEEAYEEGDRVPWSSYVKQLCFVVFRSDKLAQNGRMGRDEVREAS